MIAIRASAVLAYYDGVEVFAGRDDSGGDYVGAFVDAVGDADRYLVVGVRPDRLRELVAGRLDLRSLLLESADGGWYLTLVDGDAGRPLLLEPQSGPLADTDFLPGPGFCWHEWMAMMLRGVDRSALEEVTPRSLYACPAATCTVWPGAASMRWRCRCRWPAGGGRIEHAVGGQIPRLKRGAAGCGCL